MFSTLFLYCKISLVSDLTYFTFLKARTECNQIFIKSDSLTSGYVMYVYSSLVGAGVTIAMPAGIFRYCNCDTSVAIVKPSQI